MVQLGLQDDPDNAEFQELKAELEQVISLTETAIAELKPSSVPAVVPKRSAESPVKEKWSRENHPAFKKTAPVADEEASTNFKVNDTVLAKWHSGDKGFYPARITSITGSSTAPVYIVKFKSYDTTETLRAKDIKPIINPNKRKADGTPVVASVPPPPPVNTNVISAAADINPELAQQTKREPSKVSDGPARPAKIPKKIKANKELEAGKSKWQDFAQKGKFGKAAKKDSMFRTPEGVNGRGKQPLSIYMAPANDCSRVHRLGAKHAEGSYSKSAHLSDKWRRGILVDRGFGCLKTELGNSASIRR